MLVRGQVIEQSRETFLQAYRNINSFDLERRSLRPARQSVSKREPVPVKIADGIVADSIFPVSRRDNDFDAVGAVKLIEFVRVSYDEENRSTFGTWRAPLKEHLYVIKIHSGESRGLAPGEGHEEAKLFFVEVGSCLDVFNRQTGV